ncbi:DUF3916 domain-containing protein [Lysinibacillus sp. TE18511]
MREKKIRGVKRKINTMVKRIGDYTLEFPEEFYHDYWHLHLPIAYTFIKSSKTPFKVKKFCIQTLLESAQRLMQNKPNDEGNYRVVVAVTLPEMWNSQIIIFNNDQYFKNFFQRNDQYQKWHLLSEERNLFNEWDIKIPSNLNVLGFQEIISDVDDYRYEGELWFIGELHQWNISN